MTIKLGIVGLGRMGSIFASRLLDHGFSVGVWNRTAKKKAPLIERGAIAYNKLGDLAKESEVIVISIADETALESTFSGSGGLLVSTLAGKVLVETSTVGPSFIRSLSDKVVERGGVLVDAPILGTVGPAREGRVVVVAGGPAEAIERARPALAAISRKIVHMGPVGAGSTMKLVVNMHLATYWHSLAESLAMGRKNGLTMDTMLNVLTDSPVATASLIGKLPLLRGESSEIGFNIGGVQKDLSTALAIADSTRTDARTAVAALSGFAAAVEDGWSRDDVARIIRVVFERSLALAVGSGVQKSEG
jgi:3-hydroxyisobutyrate dehydrogenase